MQVISEDGRIEAGTVTAAMERGKNEELGDSRAARERREGYFGGRGESEV